MVVVSRNPIPELEAALGRTASAGVHEQASRGIGGLAPAPQGSDQRSPTEVFRELRKRADRDLLAWETTFECAS
jgi:hypothetical protein